MLVIMDGYCHKLERTKMDKINQKYVKALEAAASEGVLIYQGEQPASPQDIAHTIWVREEDGEGAVAATHRRTQRQGGSIQVGIQRHFLFHPPFQENDGGNSSGI